MTGDGTLPIEQQERLHKFSHDLKNRLAGLHEAFRQVAGERTEDNKELVDFGEQQFFKALRSLEQLMDDLRVARGEQKFAPTPLDLATLVRNTIPLIEHRFHNKGQVLELEMADQVMVKGDAHYVGEMVMALLSNATKFSPLDALVRIRLKALEDKAELCVIDQGVGLNEEDLKNIFVRYAWLSSRSTNGEAQGRSSLSRAKQWANAMGGDITAESEGTGKGCAFSLTLPLA